MGWQELQLVLNDIGDSDNSAVSWDIDSICLRGNVDFRKFCVHMAGAETPLSQRCRVRITELKSTYAYFCKHSQEAGFITRESFAQGLAPFAGKSWDHPDIDAVVYKVV